MVFFILTRAGYEDVKNSINQNCVIWLNKDILNSTEIETLRSSGFEVTDFTYSIVLEAAAVESALDTIVDHHPDTSIWVEAWN